MKRVWMFVVFCAVVCLTADALAGRRGSGCHGMRRCGSYNCHGAKCKQGRGYSHHYVHTISSVTCSDNRPADFANWNEAKEKAISLRKLHLRGFCTKCSNEGYLSRVRIYTGTKRLGEGLQRYYIQCPNCLKLCKEQQSKQIER